MQEDTQVDRFPEEAPMKGAIEDWEDDDAEPDATWDADNCPQEETKNATQEDATWDAEAWPQDSTENDTIWDADEWPQDPTENDTTWDEDEWPQQAPNSIENETTWDADEWPQDSTENDATWDEDEWSQQAPNSIENDTTWDADEWPQDSTENDTTWDSDEWPQTSTTNADPDEDGEWPEDEETVEAAVVGPEDWLEDCGLQAEDWGEQAWSKDDGADRCAENAWPDEAWAGDEDADEWPHEEVCYGKVTEKASPKYSGPDQASIGDQAEPEEDEAWEAWPAEEDVHVTGLQLVNVLMSTREIWPHPRIQRGPEQPWLM